MRYGIIYMATNNKQQNRRIYQIGEVTTKHGRSKACH